MNKEHFIKSYLPKIEDCLDKQLSTSDEPQKKLYEAARYITLSQGKRLRPLLLLATIHTFQGNLELGIQPASALELLHTYSLIHDDLPCMDNDDYRRGQLTLHKKYDEATAVLTGDFLLTYPFQILSESPGLSDKQKLKMIQTLAIRAGSQGMIAGQILDLAAEKSAITLEDLNWIHKKKTADLLKASLEIGGIIAEAPPHFLTELAILGDEIGLAFQIIDDVIDVTSSMKKHGKKEPSDAVNGKTTYITFLGVEGAKQKASEFLNRSIDRLKQFPNADLLKTMLSSLVLRSE